jgi:hypothetical protein
MKVRFAAIRIAVLALALLPVLGRQESWGQLVVPPAQVPQEMQALQQLGDLRLRTYSIHGLAPLVMLVTEAPATASEVERRYRHQVTSSLIGPIERLGVSLFSLGPARRSSGGPEAAFFIFRGMRPVDRPQAIIGFAEGARAAARLLLRDSSSAALVALAPATGASAAQEQTWEEMLSAPAQPRAVLVLESLCNADSSVARTVFRERQTILVLPQYDGWLARRSSAACPPAPVSAVGMDYELMSILTDWLKRTVSFPE